ncbi:uncharacterized protein LOC131659421 [Vicia villosa]|uniref:uncharacterized protein LOC131659421 n=1 Tax=Vicia villosa TaxID=3911 RepID=UPI00273ACCA0|nr:uncharacterized protein LOC131659421 [Vicia villosa]
MMNGVCKLLVPKFLMTQEAIKKCKKEERGDLADSQRRRHCSFLVEQMASNGRLELRKKANAIISLINENGKIIQSTEGMCQLASDYFTELFQKKTSSRDRVLQDIDNLISEEDNDMLTDGFSLNEFKDAIFSMQADKSPGPDDFNPGFYHHFWDTYGTNIFKAACDWLETAAIEVIHHIKTKTRGKVREIALKLDIGKAYDKIDWDYLKDYHYGFLSKWVGWIMLCVGTVEYSMSMNGNMVGPIVPRRGLRQGDPLSPYLFILCAEGLTALIRKAENKGDIYGVKICRNAPIISHLLFSDDCFLFFKANIEETNVMKDILATYEEASGQAINFQKYEFYCSRNVNSDTRLELLHV